MKESTLAGLGVRWTGGDDGQGGGDGPLAILLHGYGAPGDDLVPLWRVIPGPPQTRYLFPEAPNAMPPQFGGGRAWWDIDMVGHQMALMAGKAYDLTLEVPEGLAAARAKVVALLATVGTPALPAPKDGRVVLGGFSQGAMLSLDVALRTEFPLSGLALLSGTTVARNEWMPLMASRRGLAVLQSHGREDPLLPFDLAEELRDRLTEAGLDVTWVPFRGGHGVPPGVTEALGSLLRGVGRATERKA